jgi:hypothetical protein
VRQMASCSSRETVISVFGLLAADRRKLPKPDFVGSSPEG